MGLAVTVASLAPACADRTARPAPGSGRPAVAASAPAPAAGLELRLSAGRRTYELSDGGEGLRRELAEFRRVLADQHAEVARQSGVRAKLKKELAQQPPSPPQALPVDLALEITNRTAIPLEILGQGDDRAKITLTLAGPAVELAVPPRLWTLEFRLASPIPLAPGATHRISIARLAYGDRGDAVRAYWTSAGTLHAPRDAADGAATRAGWREGRR
jgi:hypothetical protein